MDEHAHHGHAHLRMRMPATRHVPEHEVKAAKHRTLTILIIAPGIGFLISQVPYLWRMPGRSAWTIGITLALLLAWHLKIELHDRRRTLRQALYIPATWPYLADVRRPDASTLRITAVVMIGMAVLLAVLALFLGGMALGYLILH